VGGMGKGERFWDGGRWGWCRADIGLKRGVTRTSSSGLAFIGFVLKLGITCMLAAAFPSPVIYSHFWLKGCKRTRVLPPSTIASAQDLQQSILGRP